MTPAPPFATAYGLAASTDAAAGLGFVGDGDLAVAFFVGVALVAEVLFFAGVDFFFLLSSSSAHSCARAVASALCCFLVIFFAALPLFNLCLLAAGSGDLMGDDFLGVAFFLVGLVFGVATRPRVVRRVGVVAFFFKPAPRSAHSFARALASSRFCLLVFGGVSSSSGEDTALRLGMVTEQMNTDSNKNND